MNDKLKGIIISGVVLAALGGTLAIMKFTGLDTPPEGTESSSVADSSSQAPDESVLLIDKTEENIKTVKVTNESGGYTFTGPSASGKDAASITELKGLALNTSKVADIGLDTAQFRAYRLAESGASDLAKYGLAEPQASIDVTFDDGSERSFSIGSKSPEDRFYYVCEKGSNDVYMVSDSLIRNYLEPMEHFVDKTILGAQTDDTPEFGKLSISRKDLDYDMVFETDKGNFSRSSENMASAQVMTEPIFAYLDGTNSSDLLYKLYGLTAMEVIKVFPTDADLKEYGLDDPECTVGFSGEGYDFTLSIGNGFHEENEQGNLQTAAAAYYCTFKGDDRRNCIYKVDASALPFLTVLPNDVISSLMTYNMITDVTSIEFKGDSNDKFEIAITGEGNDAELEKVTCNGSEVDIPSFKSLYQFILVCPTKDGVYFEDPAGEPYLTMSINCADGHSDVIELYKDTDRRSIVKLNGRTSYRIRAKWGEALLKNVEAVKTGGEVDANY